jgi:hypothetical protein
MLCRCKFLGVLALAVLPLLAAPLVTRAADDAVRLVGKVKKLAKDASGFELRARGGTWEVALPPGLEVVVHVAKPMSEVAQGAQIHVLGRYQEEQEDPDTMQKLPPQIMGIVTVVVDAGFTPPPLPPKKAETGLAWHSGTLEVGAGGHQFKLDETNMQIGKTRKVIVSDAAPPGAVKRGRPVLVYGAVAGEAADRKLAPSRVAVLTARIPGKEYAAVLGD